MSENQTANQAAGTAEKLKEIDERKKRAVSKAVGAAVIAFVLAFAIKAGLMSLRPGGTVLNIVLLLWDLVVIGAPLAAGLWVYRKNR